MATQPGKYAQSPLTYRALLAQQGQAHLDSLPYEPVDVKSLIQAPAPVQQPQPDLSPSQASPSAQMNFSDTPSGSLPNNASSALHDAGDQSFNHLCQKFVEEATYGHSGIFPSAIDAWNRQQDKARPGLNGINPGDLMYFGADKSNGNAGHTGIYTGNGNFVSATDNGVKQMGLGDWIRSTGQNYLGYIPAASTGDPQSNGAKGSGGGKPIKDALGRTVNMPVKTGLNDLLANKDHAVNTIIRYETQLGDMAPAQGAQQMDSQLYPDLLKNWQLAYGASKKAPAQIGDIATEVKDALRAAIHQPTKQ